MGKELCSKIKLSLRLGIEFFIKLFKNFCALAYYNNNGTKLIIKKMIIVNDANLFKAILTAVVLFLNNKNFMNNNYSQDVGCKQFATSSHQSVFCV